MRGTRFLLGAIFLAFALTSPARAQILQGDWVDASQASIEKCRKTPIRVIVLDKQGKPASGIAVRIRQQRHAFPFGAPINALTEAPLATTRPADAPVWRCFNAASVDGTLASHRIVAGKPERVREIAAQIDRFADEGYAVRWSGIVAADPGRLPDKIAALRGEALAKALDEHIDRTLAVARRAGHLEVYTHSLGHPFLENELSIAFLRQAFDRAHLRSPSATLSIRFEDAFQGERLQGAIRKAFALRDVFVGFDAVAIEARFNGAVMQAPIERTLQWIRQIDKPVDITQLEVAGPSEMAAAINLETVLRVLFAEPTVRGIWFAGVTAEQCAEASAALVTPDGKPTASGDIADRLIRDLWWSDLIVATDELGNARARVFAGTYHISANTGENEVAQTSVLAPMDSTERTVVIQPLMIK